ncbi:MAG: hypothetical protein ABI047_17640 [Jatrophihabitantaceae bacterium]
MISVKPRTAGAAAAALVLASGGLAWPSGSAAAYGQCVTTISDQRAWVSVTCGYRPNATHFRVQTYICGDMYGGMYSGCDPNPVYGEWVPFESASSVSAYYVDGYRVSVEVGTILQ